MTTSDRYKVVEDQPIVVKEIDLSWIKYVVIAMAVILAIGAIGYAG